MLLQQNVVKTVHKWQVICISFCTLVILKKMVLFLIHLEENQSHNLLSVGEMLKLLNDTSSK